MIRFATAARSALTCRDNLVADMALTMREMAFAGQDITPDTLRQRGFTDAVIDRFGTAAVARARRDAVRQVGR